MKHTYYYCPKCKSAIAHSNSPFLYCHKCNIELRNTNFDEPAFHSKLFYFRGAWEESDARLKNPSYALKLILNGFPVPDRYITDEMKPAIEEKELRLKKDLEDLQEEQKKYLLGKKMLRHGKWNKEVKKNALQMNMTPEEYLALCKEWVSSYGEKHRQYNLTHYPPAEFPSED